MDAVEPRRAAIRRGRHLHCRHWQHLSPRGRAVGCAPGRVQCAAQQRRQFLFFGRVDCDGFDIGDSAGDFDLADSDEEAGQDVCGGDFGNGCIVSLFFFFSLANHQKNLTNE